ncbi:MAG: hypothetical protein SFT93_03855 [Rickettsiaceae bacterium]|nr:hypothetical protein [Rickettsiaceae bacterium]
MGSTFTFADLFGDESKDIQNLLELKLNNLNLYTRALKVKPGTYYGQEYDDDHWTKRIAKDQAIWVDIHDAVMCAAVLDIGAERLMEPVVAIPISQDEDDGISWLGYVVREDNRPVTNNQNAQNIHRLDLFNKLMSPEEANSTAQEANSTASVSAPPQTLLHKIFNSMSDLNSMSKAEIPKEILELYDKLKELAIISKGDPQNPKNIKELFYCAAELVAKTLSYFASYAVGAVEIPVKTVINGIAAVCKKNGKLFEKTNSITSALYEYADKERFYKKQISAHIFKKAKTKRAQAIEERNKSAKISKW